MRRKGDVSEEIRSERWMRLMQSGMADANRTFKSPKDRFYEYRDVRRHQGIVEYTNCRSSFRRMLKNRKIIALMATMSTDFVGDKVAELADEVCDLTHDAMAMNGRTCMRVINTLVAAGIPIKRNPAVGSIMKTKIRWYWEPLPWQLDMVDYYWRKAFAS